MINILYFLRSSTKYWLGTTLALCALLVATPQPGYTTDFGATVMSAADAALLQARPVLDVTKEAVKPLAPQTGFAIYKITVTNNGDLAATGVQISDDPALAGFTYSDGIASSVTLLGGATQTAVVDPTNGDTNPTWGDFDIPIGGSVEVLFGMSVDASTPLGIANNSASVTTATAGATINNFDGATNTTDDVEVTTPPFTCDSSQYIVTGDSSSQLFRVDRSTSPFGFDPIGTPTTSTHYDNTFKLNGLAFNPYDNYIYATVSGGSGTYSTYDIVRIDANGNITNIGTPGTWSGTYAAAFAGDGTYLVGGGRTLNAIDLNTSPPTLLSTINFPNTVRYTDFAVDPTDPTPNRIYFVNENGTDDTVCYGDYTTGTLDGCLPNPTGFNHNAGSQYFDGLGNLYYRSNSDQNVYLVNMDETSPDYGVATLVSSAPDGGNHDGASCAFEVFMEKEVSPENAAPGDTVTYTYTIANSSAEPLSGLIFTDTMDAGRTFVGGTLVNPLGGTPVVGTNTITITDGFIPQSSIVEISIDAVLPAPMVGSTVYNQASLSGLSTTYGGSIVSDYVASAEELDATPLKIASVGLAKNVKSGPTANLDGTFDVTYELIVENIGDAVLHDVQVMDDLTTPFGTYFANGADVDLENEYTVSTVSIASNSTDPLVLNPSFDGSGDQAILDGDSGSLAVGEQAIIEVTVTFFPDFTGGSPVNYDNQASVSGDTPENNDGIPDGNVTDLSDNGTDPDADNSRYANEAGENDVTPITVTSNASIDIVKTVAPDTDVKFGDTLTYSFTITNDGNLPATGIVISDPLPGLGVMTCANTSSGDAFANDGSGALNPSESVVCTAPYTVTQPDVDATVINNTGTVNGTAKDGTPVTDTDSAQALTLQSPAINITKTVDDPTPELNQLVTYTYEVTNTGNLTLNPVTVTDIHGGANTLSAITCGATSLAPAASTSCTATYTVNQDDVDAGSVLNTATATGSPPTGANVTDEDTAELTIETFSGISIVKTADNTSVNNGDTVTYSYEVQNTGNVTLDPVSVTDVHNGNNTLSAITCPATLLAPDASMTCTSTYVVNLDDANDGLVTNEATATGTPPSGPDVSDSDTEQVTIDPDPAISLSKTPDTALLDAGDTVTYTYTVTNNGNVTLNPVTITDVHGGDNPLSPISCPQNSLNPEESMDCTATYTVNQVDVDTEMVSNTATVSGKPPTGALVTAQDTATIEFPPGPVVGLEKSVDNLTPTAGDIITYSYEVSNVGNVTLYSLEVADIHNGTGTLSDIFCPAASLARDTSMTCTATYLVTQADIDSGNLDNDATVNGTSPLGSPVTATDDLELLFPSNPNITLAKTADPATDVAVGDEVTYSFEVTNTGNVTLNPVAVADPMAGLSAISCPATSLAPTVSMTCTATYTVNQDDVDVGSIDNTAGVSGQPPTGDPVADTAGTTVTTEDAAPAIQIAKSAAPDSGAGVGDTVTYSFAVTNTGNVTLDNIAVTDPLPGLSAVTCPTTTLAPTISTTCTATYTVTQDDVDAGAIENTATVTGDDPSDTQVEDDDSISTPVEESAPNISLQKSVAPNAALALDDNLTFTFLVENTGNVTLDPVTVTDALPGLGTITCGATSLAPTATTTCTAPYTVTQADVDKGELVNSATATGVGPNDEIVDSNANATALTLREPGLYFEKTADLTADLEVGDTVTFTFETGNTGNVTLNNVEVIDTSLPGLSAISCLSTSNGDTFNNDGNDTLDPNETVKCTATYVMTQADIDQGFAENLASAEGDPSNGDPTLTDTDSELLDTLQNPGLNLVKTADTVGGVEVGDIITYTFAIENNGNMTLTAVELSDPLPGLSGFTCGNTSEGVPFLNDGSDDLIPGETVSCTATYSVTQDDVDAGSVINEATVMGSDPAGDPTEDSSSEDVPAAQTPAISIAKSVDNPAPVVGDTITYSYLVSNDGNLTIDDISVSDVHSGSNALSAIGCPFTELAPTVSMTCTATYEVSQADIDAGILSNTATVTGAAPNDTPVTDEDTVEIDLPPAPAVDIVKTADNNTPLVGETVTYTYTVTNNGTVTLDNVSVTDVHPGVGTLSAITCDADTLAPSEVATCTATYTVLQGDIDNESLTNTATVTADAPNDDPVTDTGDETLLFDAYPLIDVSKTVDNTTPLAGDIIVYTYTVTNTGTMSLGNVSVNDVHSGSDPLGTITCGATTLLPGQSTECSALYTVTQADVDAGTLTNTATGSATDPNGTPIQETDDVTIDFEAVPAIDIVKSVDNTTPALAEIVTYSYDVTNTGNVTLNNIIVNDAHGGFIALSAITCPTDTLAPNESMTCTATYETQQEDIDAFTVSNTATVTGDPPIGGSVNANDDAILVFDARPLIEVNKSANLTSAELGDTISYVYDVTNTGTVTLTDIGVVDTHSGSDPLSAITCITTTLAPGEFTQCTATYTVTQLDVDAGTLTNSAEVSGEAPDTTVVNDTDDETVDLPQGPMISVEKTVNNSTPVVGETITYSYEVANTGNVTLSNVSLNDVHGGAGAWPGVSCPGTSLAPGASMTCTADYEVQQADVDAGGIGNDVTASADPPIGGPVEDTSDEDIVFESLPLVDIVKSADNTSADAGDTITYTYLVTNNGNVSLSNVSVNDVHGGTNALVDGGCDVTTIAPTEVATCTATYLVSQADVDAGVVANTATVTADPPSGPSVDASDDEEVRFPPGASIMVEKSVDNVAPRVGQTVTYSYTVTNTGNVTLPTVTLADVHNGTGAFAQPVCPEGDLDRGESMVCTTSYTVTQDDVNAGSVSNTATATGTPAVGDPVTGSDTEELIFPVDPGLILQKTADNTADNVVGDLITYTLTAANTGNVTLSNVVVSDPLPGLSAISCSDTSLGDPFANDSSDSLDPGESVECTATYTIGQADIDTGWIANTARVNATTPNGDPVETADTYIVPFEQLPNLSLTKDASVVEANEGDTINFTFIARNDGNVTLTEVVVSDPFDGLGAISCNNTSLGDVFTNDGTDTLDPGELVTCSAPYTVTADDAARGELENLATVIGINPDDDYETDVNSAILLVEEPPATATPTPSATPDPTATPTATATLAPTATPAVLGGSIGDYVWEDRNENGIQDDDNAGIEGVTVNLWTDDDGDGDPDTQINTTTTDADGKYAFVGLAPDVRYIVQVIEPSGYAGFTSTDQGAEDALDSDIISGQNYTGVIILSSGEIVDTADAGLLPLAATATPVATATPTSSDATATPTATVVNATATPTAITNNPTATPTAVTNNPTATLTPTPVPATATPTIANATATIVPTATQTPGAIPTQTPVATTLAPIEITLANQPDIGAPGDTVDYGILIRNPNSTTVTNVVITKVLDSRLTPLNVQSSIGTPRIQGQTVILEIDRLDPNQTITLNVLARLNEAAQAPDQISNVISVSGDGLAPASTNTNGLQVTPERIPETGFDLYSSQTLLIMIIVLALLGVIFFGVGGVNAVRRYWS